MSKTSRRFNKETQNQTQNDLKLHLNNIYCVLNVKVKNSSDFIDSSASKVHVGSHNNIKLMRRYKKFSYKVD